MRVVVMFYLGQNEDYSLGDTTLDLSEKLLQRDREEGQYICDFGEGREGRVCIHTHTHTHTHTYIYTQSSKYIFQKISPSHEDQLSP